MKIKIAAMTFILLIIATSLVTVKSQGQGQRGVRVREKRDPVVYAESHALVIGVSDYVNWPKLPGVQGDVEAVTKALEYHKFTVDTVIDPDLKKFKESLEQFISKHGLKEKNRLVIYFAGHGHTRDLTDDRQMGYLVMRDAPIMIEQDPLKATISMDEINTYAKLIESKHALFVFDSCFSGTLFRAEGIKKIPPMIASKAAQPVRQFITAGTAKQPVPDESIFRRYFVRGIEGEADQNKDGYVTGEELGIYLSGVVSQESNETQTPRYGKIQDVKLNLGDIVFRLPDDKVEEKITTSVEGSDACDRAWKELDQSKSEKEYEIFLKDCGSSSWGTTAKIKLSRLRDEIKMWDSISKSQMASDYEDYLSQYPNGQSAELARYRIKQINLSDTNKISKTEKKQQVTLPSIAQNNYKLTGIYLNNFNYKHSNPISTLEVKPLPPSMRSIPITLVEPQTSSVIASKTQLVINEVNEYDHNENNEELTASYKTRFIEFKDQSIKVGNIINNSLLVQDKKISLYHFKLNNKSVIELVLIPKGKFEMGLNATKQDSDFRDCLKYFKETSCQTYIKSAMPTRIVNVDPFYLSKYEITQFQWKAVMQSLPKNMQSAHPNIIGDNLPVVNVSWDEAKEFVTKLGNGFRLPSESEWEYAANGGNTTNFSFGDSIDTNVANYSANNILSRLLNVGYYNITNSYGLYDMHGNVNEWCEDDWHENYNLAPKSSLPWIDSKRGLNRVIRGGGWRDNSYSCKSTHRSKSSPLFGYDHVGFRIAKSVNE